MSATYNMNTLPADFIKVDPPSPSRSAELPTGSKWSGPNMPPPIGSRVVVRINGLGSGKVESYFVEAGWLGVCVRLENDPEWHVRQCKGKSYAGCALVFGAELEA